MIVANVSEMLLEDEDRIDDLAEWNPLIEPAASPVEEFGLHLARRRITNPVAEMMKQLEDAVPPNMMVSTMGPALAEHVRIASSTSSRSVFRALLVCTYFGLLSTTLAAQGVAADSAFTSVSGPLAGPFTLDASALERAEQPAGPAPTPRHTGVRALFKDLLTDYKHLPSKENALWLSLGGGLALAGHPFDDDVNEALVGNSLAEDIFRPGAIVGAFPTLVSTSVVIYTVGRTKDEPKVSHLGMDLIQSLIVSESMVQATKYATRRERPDGSSKNSFPSGHSSDTFAFATALERHLGWRGAVPAYIAASYVAISRLPANRHWLSDVLMGASVGIVAGRTVTRHGREYPVSLHVVPGGVALLYVK